MLAALRGADREELRAALIALEAGEAPIDTQTCVALIGLLDDDSKEVRRRAAGALSIAAANPAHRTLLEYTLEDEQPRRRWCAAFALSRAGALGEAVLHAAIEALGAADGDVRWAAAEIVCQAARARPESLRLVREALRSLSPEQRKMAVYCVRDLQCGDSQLFMPTLDDSDRGVRLAGLSALARLDPTDRSAVDRIIACMNSDADDGVRRAAAAIARRLAERDSYAAEALARAVGEGERAAPDKRRQ